MILGIADYPKLERSLEDLLDFASRLKVSVLELRVDRLELLLSISKTHKIEEIKNLSKSYDFRYFIHAPNIDTNLASMNPFVRRVLKKIASKVVTFAAELDAELLVSHVGRLSRDYPQKFVEKAMKNSLDSLRTFSELSHDRGIVFTIENDHRSTDYVLAGYPEQINYLVENVGCKLTFDTGHANTIGRIDDFTKLLGRFIVNVHVHDNDGNEDEHLAVGKGSIDFAELFKTMKASSNQAPLIIECHSLEELRETVDYLKRKSFA
jgi:sugar phosphate isomerase/epimerase